MEAEIIDKVLKTYKVISGAIKRMPGMKIEDLFPSAAARGDVLHEMAWLQKFKESTVLKDYRPTIIIGFPIISKLVRGKEVHLESAVLIPDDQLMNESVKP